LLFLILQHEFFTHAWLSFDVPEILAGNLISDFVKGKKKFELQWIQKELSCTGTDSFMTNILPYQGCENILKMFMVYMPGHLLTLYTIISLQRPKEFSDEAALARFSRHSYAQLNEYSPVFPSVSLWYLNICESKIGSIITA
jgi:hypothetical protein